VALLAALIVVALVWVIAASRGSTAAGYSLDVVRVNGTKEADGPPFVLRGDLYLPEVRGRAPAVLLAHGYGGSKDSVADQAKKLAGQGFVVLAYSARGFGGSGGKIHLNSPDFEVKDAQLMLDYLAQRPEVMLDRPGDPLVGVAGESYGGALALLLAGLDRRVDALVPSITWHDLRQALFPQFATTGAQTSPATLTPITTPGVFKKQWTALFLGSGALSGAGAGAGAGGGAGSAPAAPDGSQDPRELGLETLSTACGNVDPQLCLGYVQAATTGRPTPELLDLLAASSPSAYASRITAPTLLIQGENDSLFPLSEADANARAIASTGTPVQVLWYAGGHDGDSGEGDRLDQATVDFLDRVLRHPSAGSRSEAAARATQPARTWRVSVPDAAISSVDTNPITQRRSAPSYPGTVPGGAGGQAPLRLTEYPLSGEEQLAVSPPGATPAALTSLPGAGTALGLLGGLSQGAGAAASSGAGAAGAGGAASAVSLGQLPGQTATFQTPPLTRPITITGSSRVTVRVSSTAQDATLFASLLDVAPDGRTTLPQQLVSPVRLDNLPAAGRTVTLALPAVVHDVPAGHRLRVVMASTDQAYALPADARGYRIGLDGGTLTVPQVPLVAENDGAARGLVRPAILVGLGLVVLYLFFAVRSRRARRRSLTGADPDLLDVPLAIENLGKQYGDGFRAVRDVTFRVESGQVLGLLGPNGAGKTTTLRMLMGLITPTEGEIRVFGHKVTPGAAVLSRLGSFIEGPGFLPHLSGLANLNLYWRATGRPLADSQLDLALEIAGLHDDVHRKVRTYSQGMRQRLAIAQAMLGLPDLLVLDEPTNGLDPPQIRQMRAVLRRYADTGRTVIVSSHLLAEVEQTCSHVVVMQDGRLVAQGTVEELAGSSTLTVLDVSVPARAASLAAKVTGVTQVETTPTGLTVHAGAGAREALVRALVLDGLRVGKVAPQRGLEESFLALVGKDDQ
jgi:ABC-2 type transport system ATP-binding protein